MVDNYSDTKIYARDIRIKALEMVHRVNASHIGGALSIADIFAVLYGEILNIDPKNPEWSDRDRLIYSKGHACSSLYAALALRGFFPEKDLETFGLNGSSMMTHISHYIKGVEFSTGSLGHGLPFGCGKALAAKRQKKLWRTFVIVSDGEMNEGTNWEAILFAGHHQLDNLTMVIDYNKIQSLDRVANVLKLDPLSDKLNAFGWTVKEVDGHDHVQIKESFGNIPWEPKKPCCLIAHTIKGKGVDFMEDKIEWHYKSPNNEQLQSAIKQLKEGE